ncbi:MAG: ribosomal protein S18-alanine N-acetyltransferase [Granulosicoccaceae bacterium]
MQPFDLAAVMAVERSAYSLPWSEKAMSDCLAGPYTCEVVSGNGELVAHMITQQVLDELHLINLCVSRAHQRQGIGLLLIQHLLDSGRRSDARQVFLEVRRSNQAALQLYRGMGFEAIGTRRDYYRDKQGHEDAVVMALSLP